MSKGRSGICSCEPFVCSHNMVDLENWEKKRTSKPKDLSDQHECGEEPSEKKYAKGKSALAPFPLIPHFIKDIGCFISLPKPLV